ncbi:MAG: hypothetical protein DHS20C14_12000 [Phycisphaeraceae bacterium]|nr:MAG: hypothetical protein DHS20C14_12000 [Phycisphaeraceae bacterium]
MLRRVRDDRGTRVRVLSVDQVDGVLRRSGSFGSVNRYVRLGWRVFAERYVVSILAPMGVFVALIVLMLIMEWWRSSLVPWAVFGLSGLFFVVFAMVPTRSLRGVTRRLGVCWSCGYDLKGLPAAADGCVVCPECGAAWRVRSADG